MKRIYVALIVIMLSFNLRAQLPRFNMGYKTPLLYNPALTGVKGKAEINSIFKSELKNSIHNYYESFDTYLSKLHGGIGLYHSGVHISTGISIFQKNNFGLNYSIQNSINEEWAYSLGINFELTTSRQKYLTLIPVTSNTGSISYTYIKPYTIYKSSLTINSNFGGIIYSDKLFFGVSIHNLINYPYLNYQTNFGYKLSLSKNENINITPSIFLSYQEYYNLTVIGKIDGQLKWLNLGAQYSEYFRSASIGVTITDFTISYTFSDVYKSIIPNYRYDHEFSIQYKLPNLLDRKSLAFNHFLF